MGAIIFKQNKYGGNTDVTDGNHVIVDNGSGSNATVQQMYNNILNNIATVETTSTASKNYAVDEHLIYNSLLYKVIETIAQGDTFVIGTNITRINIMDNIPSDLPDIDTSDNGKFLQVVNGQWTAVTIPSANGGAF